MRYFSKFGVVFVCLMVLCACRGTKAVPVASKNLEPPRIFKETYGTISTQVALEGIERNVFPIRNEKLKSANTLLAEARRLRIPDRERLLVNEFLKGNVPSFFQKLYKIEFEAKLPEAIVKKYQIQPLTRTFVSSNVKDIKSSQNNEDVSIVLWILKDYLAIGDDKEFVYAPLTLPSAYFLAKKLGFVLPTRKIVDDIYRLSDTKLKPIYLPPSPEMARISYLEKHNSKIRQQVGYQIPSGIVSGHKKDIVLSRKLTENPGKLAIYGWHKKSGYPTQPLSIFHPDDYVDYSHGVRLVYDLVQIGGNYYKLSEVISNPELNSVVSNEGPIYYSSNIDIVEE